MFSVIVVIKFYVLLSIGMYCYVLEFLAISVKVFEVVFTVHNPEIIFFPLS